MAGEHLTRRTQGLTESHIALIKMLAAKAVEDFLAETDAAYRDGPVEHQQEAQP